jgi:hypothetical protein
MIPTGGHSARTTPFRSPGERGHLLGLRTKAASPNAEDGGAADTRAMLLR